MIFAAIETDRLYLAPLEPADAPALAALLGDDTLARHTPGLPRPYDHDAALGWIARSNSRLYAGEEFLVGCRLRAGGGLVGVVELALRPDEAAAELGYWFDPAFWGRGLATEAVRRMVAFGFDTLGLGELRAATLVGNPASARVLAKAGLIEVAEGEVEGHAARYHRLEAGRYRPQSLAPRLVYVAAAALIDGGGRVLLARRPPGKAMAGLWEFPGGKVEPGERPRATLARELSEELSVEVAPSELVAFTAVCHRYDDFQLLMPLMVCRRWGGAPTPREGQEVAWTTARHLTNYPMPPADAPLVRELAPLLAP
ncbi:MAG TPA: bifunctional GNAT family N-acetyltransferase/(deoxy)nucleoside triphosphate pyrophosphohydrolase [Alphaproteobacteria bacterium]